MITGERDKMIRKSPAEKSDAVTPSAKDQGRAPFKPEARRVPKRHR